MAVCNFEVVAPHHYGNTQAGFLHLVRHMHHLFERRRDQAGKTDQIRLLFDCLFTITSAGTITPKSITS